MKKQYFDYAITTRSQRVYSVITTSFTVALGIMEMLYEVDESDVLTIERGELVR